MSERIRVIVVDDEPLARAGVRDLLELDPEIEVIGECENAGQAIDAIRELKPDLVLLDVQMPGWSGFDVIRGIGVENMPAVVFITAYDHFAVRAFEVDAVDYLLKPFDDERFALTLDRAKRVLRQQRVGDLSQALIRLLEKTSPADRAGARIEEVAVPAPGNADYLSRIVVKTAGRAVLVRTAEIDWVEAADYYVRLHVAGKAHLLRETMTALETRLDPKQFFRVHRSAIVNLERIRELQPYFHGEHMLILQDGTRLKLSRARREKLESMLRQKI